MAFVFVSSVTRYGISRCISNSISSDTVDNEKDVSDHKFKEYPPKVCPSESISKKIIPEKTVEKSDKTLLKYSKISNCIIKVRENRQK